MIGDERKMQEAKMAEHGLEEKPMPTIWRVPDQLWEKIEPILTEHDPPKAPEDLALTSVKPWTASSSE
jgi:hypothetical protein